MGLPTFLCWSPGWQFVASIDNCLVWKFVFESWIFIQNHEHEIHFQDVVAPTVEDYWKEMKNGLWKDREGKSVILSSDGRNDFPGHCAQYCTY